MRRLTAHRLLGAGEVQVDDVVCASPRCGWTAAEQTAFFGVVLIRRGVFRRTVEGHEMLLDPTSAYLVTPGAEQRIAHPAHGGDQATRIALEPQLLASMWGGELDLPQRALPTTPALDLRHRALIGRAAREEADAVLEATLGLVSELFARADPARAASGRPASRAERRRLVADAREVLAVDPTLRLVELARIVGASPHHLSRVFHAGTGHTVSGYRRTLRARLALEHLRAGATNLARLAADTGFADHAHLTRTLKAEYGLPPRILRHVIVPSE